ncbi:putative ABC transporter ATP-binding protein [Actinacidiphila reveromycinica]|uniref:Putative ABC transporter ATP-binding protein n=1 Tax=Actinacidiphila reveromycinica TaxID=659352 RepID=A0A7U3UZ00_9ACTN|nr:putative ABC transporter ATP-binding protein [Streptomyces sp. SN-593]
MTAPSQNLSAPARTPVPAGPAASGDLPAAASEPSEPSAAPSAGPADGAAVLKVADLHITDRATDREIVHGVSFELTPGKAVGVVGESGSGKTLTCRAALGILPAHFEISAGSVEIAGTDAATLTPQQWTALRGATISAVFQDPASYLNPSIKVGAQIAEVVRAKKGLGRRPARQRALELLRAVHLRDPELVYGQYTYELSGGMLQRVLIAAAIAAGPRVLIADEATTALDVTVQAEILDLLSDLRQRTGLALVVVSHDLAVVAQTCDEVLVMRQGEVVEHGPTREVLHAPRHAYTRLLVAEHETYGLDRFRTAQDTGSAQDTEAAQDAPPGDGPHHADDANGPRTAARPTAPTDPGPSTGVTDSPTRPTAPTRPTQSTAPAQPKEAS